MGLGWALVRIEANRGHRLNWPLSDHWADSVSWSMAWPPARGWNGRVDPGFPIPGLSILELGILASSSSAAHLASFSLFPQLWSQFREALSERRFLAENQNTETPRSSGKDCWGIIHDEVRNRRRDAELADCSLLPGGLQEGVPLRIRVSR